MKLRKLACLAGLISAIGSPSYALTLYPDLLRPTKTSGSVTVGGMGPVRFSDVRSYTAHLGSTFSTNRFFADALGPAAYATISGLEDASAQSKFEYTFVIDAQTSLAADIFQERNPTITATGSFRVNSSRDAPSVGRVELLQGAPGGSGQDTSLFHAQCVAFMNIDLSGGCGNRSTYSVQVRSYRIDDTRIGGSLILLADAIIFGGPIRASAEAEVDPMISIDQTFLAEFPEFTITQIFNNTLGTLPDVVDGVVPGGSAVPEPASWALLIAGFYGCGGLLRRRRLAA